jgi:hypothetical protein
MKKLFFSVVLLTSSRLYARPIITEDAPTLGRATFEAAFHGSVRDDQFNDPTSTYRTTHLPLRARIGITNRLDLGFTLSHLSHSLRTGGARLKGSRPALFSPEFKYAITPSIGILAIWHTHNKEKSGQELPIARGDDYEFLALYTLPTRFKSHINVGYLSRGNYHSKFGIDGGQLINVSPGNIWEARASLEIPLKHAFSGLTELSYYDVGTKRIGGVNIDNSAGQAMDALVGIIWEDKGWNIGLAAAFGLLDESHTSFDLERGAGDVTYHLTFSYRLKAKKPY